MKKSSLIIVLSGLLIFVTCKKEENTLEDPNNTVESFTATINGSSFAANSAEISGSSIEISGGNATESITFDIGSGKSAGTYNLSGWNSTSSTIGGRYRDLTMAGHLYQATSGSVTFTKYDLGNNVIEGTFSFEGYIMNGDTNTVSLTSGAFNVLF